MGERAPVRCLVRDRLGDRAGAWDDLVDAAPVVTPFLRSWWLAAVAPASARFLLFVRDDELVGGLALQRRARVLGVDVYQFCGAGPLCPDHLDLLARPAHAAEVVRAARRWFAEQSPCVLDLDGIVAGSMLAQVLGPQACQAVDVAPFDELPAAPEDYLASRPAGLRRKLRVAERKLAADGYAHRRVHPAEAPAAIAEFVRMHRARGDRGALLAQLPVLLPALLAGVAANEVRIDTFGNARRTVAVDISFCVGGALRAYQNARETGRGVRDVGTVLHLHMISSACADGCREVDLLRGGEPYKDQFVTRRRALYRARVALGARGAALLAAARVAAAVRRGGAAALRGSVAAAPGRVDGQRGPGAVTRVRRSRVYS